MLRPSPLTEEGTSPNGTREALTSRDEGEDIWIWDFGRENMVRFTSDPALDRYNIWTIDSREIPIGSDRSCMMTTYRQAADGSGSLEVLNPDLREDHIPNAVTPDGKQAVLRTGASDLLLVSLESVGPPRKLLATEARELNEEISPDGRWLAYQSNEAGGEDEIWVRPFPDVQSGRTKISTAGGRTPAWSPDGNELFYATPEGLMVVPVRTTPSFSAGRPRVLFHGPYLLSGEGRNYDVSPGGERFLMIKLEDASADPDAPSQIVVVQNWAEEMKSRVGN